MCIQCPTTAAEEGHLAWWNEDIRAAKLTLKPLHRRCHRYWRRTRCPPPWHLHHARSATQAQLNAPITKAKADSWKQLTEDITDQDLWNRYHQITRPKTSIHLTHVYDLNDNLLQEDGAIANAMLSKFFPSYPGPHTAFQ